MRSRQPNRNLQRLLLLLLRNHLQVPRRLGRVLSGGDLDLAIGLVDRLLSEGAGPPAGSQPISSLPTERSDNVIHLRRIHQRDPVTGTP